MNALDDSNVYLDLLLAFCFTTPDLRQHLVEVLIDRFVRTSIDIIAAAAYTNQRENPQSAHAIHSLTLLYHSSTRYLVQFWRKYVPSRCYLTWCLRPPQFSIFHTSDNATLKRFVLMLGVSGKKNSTLRYHVNRKKLLWRRHVSTFPYWQAIAKQSVRVLTCISIWQPCSVKVLGSAAHIE